MPNPCREIEIAEDKAIKLLVSHLSLSQRHTWEKWRFFYVRGIDGHLYALSDGYWVVAIRDGKPNELRGIYPNDGGIPLGDRILAQKLGLETDAHFLDIACQSALYSRLPEALGTGQFLAECRMFYGLRANGITGEIVEDARKVLKKKKRRPKLSWYKRILRRLDD